MEFLGLDIGFGDVKAVCDGVKIKIPTAVAYAEESACELGAFSQDYEEYLFANRKYIVGESAMSKAFSTRSYDFLKRYAPLLTYKVIKGLPKKVTSLATGLPLAYFTQTHKADFMTAMKRITVDSETMELDVAVFPQGVGALLDYRLNDKGEANEGTAHSGLVIDIGFNTVDVVAFKNGSAMKPDSGMLERAGISKPAQDLARILQKETTINLTEQEAKDVLLNGGLSVYGHDKDLSEIIRRAIENYVEWLLSVITSRWEDRLQRADKLILAGGGAYYLESHLPSKYRKLLYISDEPEFANARGFLKASKAASKVSSK